MGGRKEVELDLRRSGHTLRRLRANNRERRSGAESSRHRRRWHCSSGAGPLLIPRSGGRPGRGERAGSRIGRRGGGGAGAGARGGAIPATTPLGRILARPSEAGAGPSEKQGRKPGAETGRRRLSAPRSRARLSARTDPDALSSPRPNQASTPYI